MLDALSLLSRAKHQMWMALGCHTVALPLFRAYGWLGNKPLRVVNISTEIVIEGYPRCANTMAVAYFLVAQSRPVEIARHLHAPAQVIWAMRHGLPALVLTRRPLEAVASLLIRAPQLSARQALLNYRRFYEWVQPFKERLVVADFDTVIHDFSSIIYRINRRYETCFSSFEATEENLSRCITLVEAMDREDRRSSEVNESTVARPSIMRSALKADVIKNLIDGPSQSLLNDANHVYESITDHENGHGS